MGKKTGYLPENVVYLGTTNMNEAQSLWRWRVGALTALFIIDLSCASSLYTSVHLWNLHGQSARGFLDSLLDFTTDSSDLLVFSILRILCLVGLAYYGSALAWQEAERTERAKELKAQGPGSSSLNGHQNGNKSSPRSSSINGEQNGGLKEPLLIRKDNAVSNGKPPPAKGFEEWFSGSSKKDIVLFVVFLLCTGFQAYVGAKCVGFYFDTTHRLWGVKGEVWQSVLMGTQVAWILCESRYVHLVVDARRILSRALYLRNRRKEKEQNAGATAFASSKPAPGLAQQEGTLRGDKGLKEETEVDQNRFLMRAISLAREEVCLIFCAFACLAVSSASGLLLPRFQGRILDHAINNDRPHFKTDIQLLIVFTIITGLFEATRNLCFTVVGKRVLKTLQDRLFMGVVRQDIAYFDGTTSGELTSRLTNDVSSMAEPINWMLSSIVRNLIALVGAFVLCFSISWKLSMLAFTTMAPIMHITAVYSRWSRELNRKRYALLAEANSAASEALGNVRTVRAFSTEEVEIDRFKSKTLSAMQKGVRDAFAYAGAVAVNDWLDLGASVLILWYGGTLVMQGRLSAGKLITFELYWNQIQSAYQSIMSVLMSLTRAAGAAQRVLSLVDALPDIDPNAGTMVSTLDGEIKLEDVKFHYQMRPQHPVLTGVSLHVGQGQVCALVGRSGGGKSTIVHLLMRFYDPTGGKILLDGWDLRHLNLKSVHKHMGLVAQDTQMFACSIEENITYGLTKYTLEEMEEAARYANAHEFIMRFPDGYATRVGERGVRLSGGQRQRIAIARMLLRRPKVLLLDEATSSLDTESEALVQQALDRLISEGGRTVVLVAHRLSTVRNADMIAVMEKGSVVEQGHHEELLERNGVYQRLVRRQLNKVKPVIDSEEDSDENGDSIG
ncbi:protein MpABC65 [Marchantia polymorpha subsp. ruderalis]